MCELKMLLVNPISIVVITSVLDIIFWSTVFNHLKPFFKKLFQLCSGRDGTIDVESKGQSKKSGT